MRFLRSKHGFAVVGALVLFACVTLFVVIPAFGSTAGDYVNPGSGDGVLPLDVAVGGNGDCSLLFPSLPAGVKEYDNNNPKTVTGAKSGNNDNVTFDLNLHSPTNSDQTLDVKGHGAAIVGIGVKGGTQSTAYNYVPGGFVAGDTALHAPLSNNSYTISGGVETSNSPTPQFYQVSLLNICYETLSYIQGTVYQDANQNGTNDDNSSRVGWTVDLYSGVTPGTPGGGSLIAHTQTDATGKYHFDVAVNGSSYRVCEQPLSSDNPSNGGSVWVQSQPQPSTKTLCTGTGESAKGYDFTPTSTSGAMDDFGNVGGFPCGSAGSPVGIGDYTVSTCKGGQQYVFSEGTTTLTLNNKPTTTPYVDYWVSDPSQANIPVVEQINFADPIDPTTGLPTFTKLLYADGGGFPVSFNNLTTMPYCSVDPRQSGDNFALQSQYAALGGSSSVLPGPNTSCVISIRTAAPVTAGGTGTLQAYVYALGDSVRTSG